VKLNFSLIRPDFSGKSLKNLGVSAKNLKTVVATKYNPQCASSENLRKI